MKSLTEKRPAHDDATVGRAVREIACLPPAIATNPYQRLLYSSLRDYGFHEAADPKLKAAWLYRARSRRPILHFHWPQSYYWNPAVPRPARRAVAWAKLSLFAARLLLARALGFRIAWTVHQLYPHEHAPGRLDKTAAHLLTRLSAVLIAHDSATTAHIRSEFGIDEARIAIIPHGSFVGIYPAGRSREAVREVLRLDRDQFVFLSFGLLRGYKATGLLLDAFGALDSEDAVLIVAGLPVAAEAAEELKCAATTDPRIRVSLDFVPDDGVRELFGACDAAVLARGDGGTSGALVLALSLGCPVVAARTPTYETLLDGERAGWLFEPDDADSLQRALLRAASDRRVAAEKGQAAFELAGRMSWCEVAALTAAALTEQR